MAVIETISAIITIASLTTTLYFKRHQARRFCKRQAYLLRVKYKRWRDKKATDRTAVRYTPVSEFETTGLKHADNLEELEQEIIDQCGENIDTEIHYFGQNKNRDV